MIDGNGVPVFFTWIMYCLNPGGAVVVFFVLSGYVLGKSLSSDTNLVSYICKRALRILPAFVFSVIFAAVIISLVHTDHPPEVATSFFRSVFWPPLTWSDLWNNLLFIDFRVNGPTWSIWPELVGSAFVPIFFLIHSRFSGAIQWVVAAFILATIIASPYCRYLIYFYAGLFLVPRLLPLVINRGWGRVAMLVIGTGILAFFGDGNSNYSLKTIAPPALGATLLVAAIASASYWILECRPLRYLGRISYSFYLLHWPIFYLCAIAGMSIPTAVSLGFIGNLAIMIVSIAVSVIVAIISYSFIEQPFRAAGRSMFGTKNQASSG